MAVCLRYSPQPRRHARQHTRALLDSAGQSDLCCAPGTSRRRLVHLCLVHLCNVTVLCFLPDGGLVDSPAQSAGLNVAPDLGWH